MLKYIKQKKENVDLGKEFTDFYEITKSDGYNFEWFYNNHNEKEINQWVNQLKLSDDNLKKFLKTWDGIGEISQSYQQWMTDNGKATSTFTTFTKKASSILKSFGSTLGSMAVDLLFDEIVGELQELAQSEKNLSEKNNELFDESNSNAEEYNYKIDTLNQLEEKYIAIAEKGNIDSEKRKELVQLQGEINSLLGKHVEGLDLVNGNLEEQVKKIKEISQEEKKSAYRNSIGNYNNAKKASSTARAQYDEDYNYVYEERNIDESTYDVLKNAGFGRISTMDPNMFYELFNFSKNENRYISVRADYDENGKELKTLQERIDYLKRMQQALLLGGKGNTGIYSSITSQIIAWEKVVSNQQTAANNLVDNYIAYNLDTSKVNSIESFEKYRKELFDNAKNNPEISQAIADKMLDEETLQMSIDSYMSTCEVFSIWYEQWKNKVEGKSKDDISDKTDNSSPLPFNKAWKQLKNGTGVFKDNDKVKNTYNDLISLAEAGKLTVDTFNNTIGSDIFLEQINSSAEETTNKINSLVDEAKQLSSLKAGITTITSAYDEKKDSSDHRLGADTLNSIYDSLDIESWKESDLEVWEKYKNIASSSTSSLKEFKQAQDSLATSFINSNNFLSQLDNSNKDYYTSLLREMGITNASAVVNETLRRNKARLAIETYNSLDAHDKDADALDKVRKKLKKCSDKEREYYFAKLVANGENIDTKEECQQLIDLAKDLHLNSILIDTLSEKLDSFDNTSVTGTVSVEYQKKNITSSDINGYNAKKELKEPLSGKNNNYFKKGIPTKTKSKAQVLAEQEAKEQKEKLKAKIKTTEGSKSGKNADNAAKNSETKQEINWLERRLTRMQSIIDLTASKLQNVFSVKSKNNNLNTQISQTTKLMNQYKKAAGTYMEKANSVAKTSKVDGKRVQALSKDDIKKIQSGEITKANSQKLIQKYGQNYADKINSYIDYYDKAQDAKKNKQEQEAKIRELEEQKYQNYVDLYDSRISRAEAKESVAIGAKNQNKAVQTQIKNTELSYNYQIKIANLTDDKAKADQLEYEKQKAIVELKQKQIDNLKTEYDNSIRSIDNSQQNKNNQISQMETRGQIVLSSFYTDLNNYESQKLAELKNELADLESRQNNFKDKSTEWYNLQSDIQDVKNAINDAETAIIENNKKVGELRQAMYDDIAARNSNIASESQFMASLLGNNLTNEKNGDFTEEGLAVLGTYAINAESSASTARAYAQERKEIEKQISEYKNGNNHALDAYGSLETAKNRLSEVIQNQRDALSSEYDNEKQIYDLMTQRYESQLSYMNTIIDAKKELFDMEKDLYDYEKNINNQTKNIASLEKQLAALQGDDSEEGRAKKSAVQRSLDEANEELQDTEYERYISEQQNMLDNLYSQYEDLIHELEQNFETVVQKGISTINEKSDVIVGTLSNYVTDFGYNPSEDMSKILGALTTSGDGDVKTLPGSITNGLSNLGVIFQKGVTDIMNAYNGTNAANNSSTNKSSSSEADTSDNGGTPNRNGSIVIQADGMTTTVADMQKNIQVNSERDQLKKLMVGKNYSSKANKNWNKYSSKLNQLLAKHTGYVIKDGDNYIDAFAKMLNLKAAVKGKSGSKYAQDGNVYQSLKKRFPSLGFSHGGIGRLVKASGEDGFALVRNGEGFIAPEHVESIQSLMNIIPDMTQFTNALTHVEPVSRELSNQFGDIVINAELPNIANVQDFVQALQHDRKTQQALTIATKDLMEKGRITNRIQNIQ